jgi:hypothetical protein
MIRPSHPHFDHPTYIYQVDKFKEVAGHNYSSYEERKLSHAEFLWRNLFESGHFEDQERSGRKTNLREIMKMDGNE